MIIDDYQEQFNQFEDMMRRQGYNDDMLEELEIAAIHLVKLKGIENTMQSYINALWAIACAELN